MRANTVLPLLFGTFVIANPLAFGSQKLITEDDTAVPGNSPLTYCQQDTSNDILVLEKVDVLPNPPVKGQKLSVSVKGRLQEEVEQGAYLALQVKYGLIKLISMEMDLCDEVSKIDLTCPINGTIKIEKEVDLPELIPPGKYTVAAEAFTARPDSRRISCLQAKVEFQ